MAEFVDSKRTGSVWYSPILYNEDSRTKETAKEVYVVAADADACDPNNFRMQPNIVVETSPSRWHVYWFLTEGQDPNDAAKVNRRIARVHKDEGCDPAFVNAAKLMRVPGTSNHKYPGAVVVIADHEPGHSYKFEEIRDVRYPEAEIPDAVVGLDAPMPDDLPEYIEQNRASLLNGLPNTIGLRDLLFGKYHEEKRSEVLFKLCCELYRAGMDDYAVAAVAWGAPSNKFREEDPRGLQGLWSTAVMAAKAHIAAEESVGYGGREDDEPVGERFNAPKEVTDFLTAEEREQISGEINFIDEWIHWAGTKTDAPPAFHRAAAMIALSSVYSEFGYVMPKFGKMKLNLWALTLGRSTKDRKTTAQRYVFRLLKALETDDYSYILPDDATPGGLNVALQDRADKASVLLRDEAQGFFEEMIHQSYMAGGISYFTKLYDGESGGRARASGDKKSTPSVPISFVFFMSGILDDSAEVLTVRNYKQGFLTRFLYTIGERPADYVEPRVEFSNDEDTEDTDPVFQGFVRTFGLNRNYWEMRKPENGLIKINIDLDAQVRFADFHKDVAAKAEESQYADIIESTTERMAFSILKLAALLAMHDRMGKITLNHMLQAISYAGEFYDNASRVASMISESGWQRDVDKLEQFINSKGGRTGYATAYRAFLDKKPIEFEEMLNALERRGILTRTQQGSRWILEVVYGE